MSLQPRVVQVHRRTEYDELLIRHGTRRQAAFFLEQRGRSIDELAERHRLVEEARAAVAGRIPADWRRVEVERAHLAHFGFAPEDIVVVVGQDGLVANVAKYLGGQPVLGVDPEPGRNAGVLVPHGVERVSGLLASAAEQRATIEHRTMVVARTDDGQELRAVNEVFFGHHSHQSARYRLELPGGVGERHSSSGLLAGTGTGATGWLRSAWQERHSSLVLPAPDQAELCWFAREAWPSAATGTAFTEGLVEAGEVLRVQAESDELVCFGDGVEADALHIAWGQTIEIMTAPQTLELVVG